MFCKCKNTCQKYPCIYTVSTGFAIYPLHTGVTGICPHRFVSWFRGYLGQNVMKAILSCVVLRICQEFPNLAGQYVEFRPPLTEAGDMAGNNFLRWGCLLLGRQVGGERILLNQWQWVLKPLLKTKLSRASTDCKILQAIIH